MYLADTNLFSELARAKCDPRVRELFADAARAGHPVYLSVVTVGELERGIRLLEHRGDSPQAARLSAWLAALPDGYRDAIVDFGVEEAVAWASMRVPHHENAVGKQIAATALTHGWTLVTRNEADFRGLGVPLMNPFAAA